MIIQNVSNIWSKVPKNLLLLNITSKHTSLYKTDYCYYSAFI